MAKKDYVRHKQPASPKHQKYRFDKKQRNLSFFPLSIVSAAIAVLAVSIGHRYSISHNTKEKFQSIQKNKVITNGLPIKPKERWRYIKELDSNYPTVHFPIKLFEKKKIKNLNQIFDRPHPFLMQIQTNTQQRSVQKKEEIWNKQTTEQTQKIQEQQHQLMTQYNSKLKKATNIVGQKIVKKNERLWRVQCGSFKCETKAKVVRAQLSFEGFDTQISISKGWNRVVIGPVKTKDSANNTIIRLKISGQKNCILLPISR